MDDVRNLIGKDELQIERVKTVYREYAPAHMKAVSMRRTQKSKNRLVSTVIRRIVAETVPELG